jgi:3-methyladenine DNA glycosylase AlkD
MTQPIPTLDEMIAQIKALASPENLAGQQRFAIVGGTQFGVSMPQLRTLAKGIRSHELAAQLWETNIHEARILAALMDEPKKVTIEQMNTWTEKFESWDVCDQATDELFIHTPFIQELIPQWAAREEEFVRRAAFASIAALSIHRKDIPDEEVASYFALIEAASDDARNFVWKAVNWALRNIGKFRPGLRAESVACAKRILKRDTPAARKIAKDALKEFETKFGADFVASIN